MLVKAAFWAAVCGAAICLGMIFVTMPAHAQQGQSCKPLKEALAQIHQFAERPVWAGALPQKNSGMFLFMSDKGSWTALIVQGGMGCIVAGGRDGAQVLVGEQV